MKKTSILITLVVLMAMIPLTYVIGRGGGHHGGGHHGGGRGGYHGGRGGYYGGHRGGYDGYRRGGYWGGYGYNNAAWAVPLAIGTAAAVGSAAAASSNNSVDDTTYYPEDYVEDAQAE